MELRTLRYFVGVLEAGSLSRAAGSLYVAQPALSAQIKKLEAELGVQLFERSSAGVTPTAAGLCLYEDARRLLSDAAAIRDRMRRTPEGPEGSVTIALPFMLASLFMGPALERLRRDYPRVRVFVHDALSPAVTQSMLDRRADVGILIDTPAVKGLKCRPLVQDSVFFCGRDLDGSVSGKLEPADGRTPTIAFGTAAALPLLLQSRRVIIRRRVDEVAASSRVVLNIAHEHDSTRTIRSLLLCGAGFTFAPGCSLRATAPGGASDWLSARVVDPELVMTYTLAMPAGQKPNAAAQVAMDVLIDEARTLIRDGVWDARWLAADADG